VASIFTCPSTSAPIDVIFMATRASSSRSIGVSIPNHTIWTSDLTPAR